MKLTKMQKAQVRWAKDPKKKAQAGFWNFVIQLAIFVIIELVRPKPKIEDAKPAGLGDFTIPTATEGRVVPLVWGTVRIDGPNVCWYGDLDQIAITEKVRTGMFSSQRVKKGYQYRLGMQFAIARGVVDALTGLWIGDDQVWSGSVAHGGTFTLDDPELFGGEDEGQGGFEGTFEFFEGNSTQAVSSYLSTYQTQGGDTPAYRGTCYIAPSSENWYIGNSTTIKPWKFEVQRFPDNLSLSGTNHIVNTYDANPAEVLYEIMTNTEWGLGYAPAEIDTASFFAAGNTLATEGNGISLNLTSPREASELVRLVEDQINGVVRYNQANATWEVKLIRADYTPGAQPEVNVDNMVEFVSFSRGSWEGTANTVRVQFNDRTDEYKNTFATAQDSANLRIQDVNVSVTKSYPGVMNRTTANDLAWRELRGLAYPLARTTFVVDRTFWDFQAGDVIEFTHDYLGIDRLPMRITSMDFGELENNRIRIEAIQDVFYTLSPSAADPQSTNWTEPADNIVAYPSDQQLAFEAPRALVRRDPNDGSLVSKVMGAARKSGNEITFDLRARWAAGSPTGDYTTIGTGIQFMKVGELNAAITTKSAYPATTVILSSTPDTQAALLAAFAIPADTAELGTTLMNLVLVDDEFMLVETAQANGANVQLNNVYRGVLDSVQTEHAANAEVYVLMAGATIADDAIPETNQVDALLIPVGFSAELAEAAATVVNFTMDKRTRRPYPPSELDLNGTTWDTTAVSLEANGTNAEDFHIDVDWLRRDYRVADNLNEIDQLGVDANTLYSDFPTAQGTDHLVSVSHDPTGTNETIYTAEVASGTNFSLERLLVLQGLSGAVPTGDLRVTIQARHTDGGEVLTSRQSLVHDFAVSTTLTGDFEFGALDVSATSATYTATVNGTYSFDQVSAFTAGLVQYRLNAGAWTTLIPNGSTTGSIVGVVATDTIEVRHTSSDAGLLKHLTMTAPGAGQDGFAVLEP